MGASLHPALSLRLYAGEEKAFGPGPAQLLAGIRRCGSLQQAAAEMGIAYSKAWTILKNAERLLGYPLTRRTAGGRGGGGSTLSQEGEAFLERYEQFSGELNAAAQTLFSRYFPEYAGDEPTHGSPVEGEISQNHHQEEYHE